MRTHNIVSGHVTRRAGHASRVAGARKIARRSFWTIVSVFFAMLALGMTLNALAGNLVPR
jgi:hypothetical protein